MKKHWKLTVVLIVVVVVAWSWRGSAGKDPDQKLVGHFDNICKIAEKGIESPHRGVKKLFGYYTRNGPEMLKQFGALLVHIERIGNDEAHDKRAELAGRRMNRALVSCAETYERFGMAIEDDPKALALVERGFTRLGRSLELIFGTLDQEMLPGLSMLSELRGTTAL